MTKTFVIAGTKEEAQRWIKQDLEKRYPNNTSLSLSNYVYVDGVDRIKGYSNPHGVFVGNWLGRPDIFEIVEALMLASVHVNPALGKIYDDLKPKVRPTPKLKPVNGGWINTSIAVQIAAQELANEIDNHIVQELSK